MGGQGLGSGADQQLFYAPKCTEGVLQEQSKEALGRSAAQHGYM